MTQPALYAQEVPLRAHRLITRFWDDVTREDYGDFGGPLATTFVLALAAPMINIPYERLYKVNPGKNERKLDEAFQERFRAGIATPRFSDAPFRKGEWRYHYVPGKEAVSVVDLPADVLRALSADQAVEDALNWCTKDWYECMRNGLAHSTVAYLDGSGAQLARAPTEMMVFVTQHWDNHVLVGHHLVRITRDDFRDFLDHWAVWLQIG